MVNSSNKPRRLNKNYFRIKGRSDLFIKDQVIVNFTPLRKKKGQNSNSILPLFNSDRKHYTISFRLPSTQQENQNILIEDHNRRVTESLLQISQILYPKPRCRHKYCGVCRGYYQDYKTHVQSQQHLRNLQNSTYQKYIRETIDKMCPVQQKKEEDDKTTDSFSEQQIFKCLSTDTIQDCFSFSNRKREEDELEV